MLERTLASARKQRAGVSPVFSAQSARPHDARTPGNVLDFSALDEPPSIIQPPPHSDPWQPQPPPLSLASGDIQGTRLDFEPGGLPLPSQRHGLLDTPGLLDVLQSRQRPPLTVPAEPLPSAEQVSPSGQRPHAPPPGNASSQAAAPEQLPQRAHPPASEPLSPEPAASAHLPLVRVISEELPTLSDAGTESLLDSERLADGGDSTSSEGSGAFSEELDDAGQLVRELTVIHLQVFPLHGYLAHKKPPPPRDHTSRTMPRARWGS